jgi:hypothetical protein
MHADSYQGQNQTICYRVNVGSGKAGIIAGMISHWKRKRQTRARGWLGACLNRFGVKHCAAATVVDNNGIDDDTDVCETIF